MHLNATNRREADMSAPGFVTVAEFCQAHRLSKATFYRLLANDTGPRITKLGSRTLISREAAEEWQDRVDGRTTATSKPARTLSNSLFGARR
jgi:predicted DNA-binding transcriptional regulator AlpA